MADGTFPWCGNFNDLVPDDQRAVAKLVVAGSAVVGTVDDLLVRLRRSRRVALFREKGTNRIVAAAAWKRPVAAYRRDSFIKADTSIEGFETASELGYVVISPDMQGKQLSGGLVMGGISTMAKIDVIWAETDLISVFDVARDLGFDLRKYDRQVEEVQKAVKKATVDKIIMKIREDWRAAYDHEYPKKLDFNRIANGVYVIKIGDGFAVKYEKDVSEIMYIGRGKIASRLRTHLNNWIFDMSRSLRDVPFKFYMETVGDRRSKNAFKDFEHFMLDQFMSKYGEKPLLNKIHGREGHIDHEFTGNWNSPLRRSTQCLWQIRPSVKNSWFKEQRDD